MVTSLNRSHACTIQSLPPTLHQASSNPRLHQKLFDPHRHVFCGVTVPFSWVLVRKVLLRPPKVCFPVLCKFWQLYGELNGDLLQEDLCNTHTQSPCPCGRPLPTCTSAGDTQTQFCLSLCGVPRFWCAMGFDFKREFTLLQFCWGFSFALECGVSPHSPSSVYCLTGISLILNVGYLFMAAP